MNKLSYDLNFLKDDNCLNFWNEFKLASNNDMEDGFKLALEIWSDNVVDGEKTACNFASRNQIANDIAASMIVDSAIEKMAGLSGPDREELLKLNAELNVFLLSELSKEAALSPAAIGGLVGGGLGAAEGAYEWYEDDKPLSTIAARAIPGAAIGALAGHGYSELKNWKKQLEDLKAKSDLTEIAKKQLEDKSKAELAEKAKAIALKRDLHKKNVQILANRLAKVDPKASAHLNQFSEEIIDHLMNDPKNNLQNVWATYRALMP